MKLREIKCPSCGGYVNVTEDQDTCFCSYCGCQLSVEGRMVIVVKQHHIIEDKAKLRELELKEEDRLRNEKKAQEIREAAEAAFLETRKRKRIWWVVTLLVPIFIVGIEDFLNWLPSSTNGYGLIVLILLVVPAILVGNYPNSQLPKFTKFYFYCVILFCMFIAVGFLSKILL